MTKLILAVLAALLIPTAAWADFNPSAKSVGEIFTQAQAPPSRPFVTGPTRVALFRAGTKQDYLYLWVNDQPMFDRFGLVMCNDKMSVSAWLTAIDQRSEIWDFSLSGKVNEIAVCQTIGVDNQAARALDVAALTSLAKVVVLMRTQVALRMDKLPELPNELCLNNPDNPYVGPDNLNFGLLPYFANKMEPASARCRIDGVIYTPRPDQPWSGGPAAAAVGPVEGKVDLPLGRTARKKALIDLAVSQEKRFAAKVKELLDRLVAEKED